MFRDKATRHFERGIALFSNRRFADAAVQFQAAVQLEHEASVVRPKMRYRSFLGLSRALSGKVQPEDVRLCEQAANLDQFDPVLMLNLGKVYLRTGKHTKAVLTFRRGLRLEPEHRELRVMYRRSDRRSAPIVPGLSRDHPLNVSLGRLRARWTRRSGGR
jgi:hypothetical protein